MGEDIKLAVESRTDKEKLGELRRSGFIPAVIYGAGHKNRSLKVKALDFEKVFARAGETNLVDLSIDGGKPAKVLIYETEKNGIKGKVMHIDFYQVDMKKKIKVEVPLNFIGEAKAVRELGGTLVKVIDEVEVECLPEDLVNQIDVDISGLNTFDDAIKLSDLKLPQGVVLVSQTDELVVQVEEVKEQVEEAPAAAEGQATAEGEAAAAATAEGQATETVPAEKKEK